MNDYISRQDAIAEFSCCDLTPDGGIDANYAIDFLEQMPSADVRENVKGKWYIPKEYSRKTYRRICTNCLNVAYYCGTGNYRYCPNCGADMRGDNERS